MRPQIPLRRLEHAPAEAHALVFGREIEFEDLPAQIQRGHAITSVAHVTCDLVREIENHQPRAARNRAAPPHRTAPQDHALQFAPRNNAAVGVPPRRVVHTRDLGFIAETRSANGYDGLDHGEKLRPAPLRLQGLDSGPANIFALMSESFIKGSDAILSTEFGVENADLIRVRRGVMSLRRSAARVARSFALGALVASLAAFGAHAEMLRATYNVSLIGLPIGVANVNATLTPNSYTIAATAKLSGLATLLSRSRGASAGQGAIVGDRIVPATFATTAQNATMTRTIRMSIAGNAVTGVDISPPFEEKPDRIPLSEKDLQGIVDPVGAFVIPAPAKGPIVGPAACDRTIPVFDGYTRFDITLAYVGQREVSAKGYSGPVAVCSARYVPIAGHRRDRPATKFMADNKDLEVWLAPDRRNAPADAVPRFGANDDRHHRDRSLRIQRRSEIKRALNRHCEERSDEAIHRSAWRCWIASLTLAMTAWVRKKRNSLQPALN